MGLARQARSEAPQSRLPIIDLDVVRPSMTELTAVSKLADKLGLGYSGTSEPEMAFDGVIQRVPRLTEAAGSLGGPIKLYFDARGALSNLRVVPQAAGGSAPAHGESQAARRRGRPQLPRRAQRARRVPGRPGPAGRRLRGAHCAPRARRARTCRWATRCSATASPHSRRSPVGRAARGGHQRSRSPLSTPARCRRRGARCTCRCWRRGRRLDTGCCCTPARAASAWPRRSTATSSAAARSARVGRPHKHFYLHPHGPRRPHAQLARRRRLRTRRVEAARLLPAALLAQQPVGGLHRVLLCAAAAGRLPV